MTQGPLDNARPDPDALLQQVQAEEARAQRGKLKIFFGAAAGVGKTYTMLSAAREKYAEGLDVLVGYAQPHARPETEMLLLGMDLLPLRTIDYRGTKLKEFDLDAALQRHPELLVVDELAHTNAPGCRHAKRWQDVEELLQAGIDVYTTLNVQHIESLNDVVAQITGVIVHETVPDAVFERAEEVEVVDLPPDDLLERLRDGKVYIPEQATSAVANFFKKSNLTALRELALRHTADRVGVQVQTARRAQLVRQTWPSAETILVCISPSPASAKVVRAAKRLATALGAPWIAAYVETPKFKKITQGERDRLLRNFGLAERLGAETVTLSGQVPADEIVNYARSRNVTKIIAGKSDRPWWLDLLLSSNVDQLLRKSGDIDVYVIRGLTAKAADSADKETAEPAQPGAEEAPSFNWRPYYLATLAGLVCTGVAEALYILLGIQEHHPGVLIDPAKFRGDLTNLAMVYLVGVAIVAARYGRGPSAYSALLSVALFDFCFVPPRFSFNVTDFHYLITFTVMLGVGLLIGTLTVRIREQADDARLRERRTEALYRTAQQLADASALPNLLATARRNLEEVFQSRTTILLPDETGRVTIIAGDNELGGRGELEQGAAQWVFDHRQPAGRGTDTLPASAMLYLPLLAAHGPVGVLGIQSRQPNQLLAPEARRQLDAFARQVALAIERHQLAESAQRSQIEAETQKLRSALLSSVSHDLRTPLAVITGVCSNLLDGSGAPSPEMRREMIQTIREESDRMGRLVGNLLDITRLESGAVKLNRQWQPLEEIIGSALNRLDAQLQDHPVKTTLPPDLPLVAVDGVLIEQVFINLVENAAKYTPTGTPIEISATCKDALVTVEVADRGPGLKAGEEKQIFEKFYRGALAGGKRGAGLGLPICRAILDAHHGRIWAENRQGPGPDDHGAVFRFTIPVEGTPPRVESDEAIGADEATKRRSDVAT